MLPRHVKRLLDISLEKSANLTFSKYLGTPTVSLVDFSKNDGVTFEYIVPESLCLPKISTGSPVFPVSAALAVFDELSTYSFMLADKNHRSGVSIHLSTEMMKDISPGEKLLVNTRADKIGKTVGFCSMVMKNSSGELVAEGKHIKYLPMGVLWDIFSSKPVLSRVMAFHERYHDTVSKSKIANQLMGFIMGGRNKGGHKTVWDVAGVGALFEALDMSEEVNWNERNTVGAKFSTDEPRKFQLQVNSALNNMVGRMHGGALAVAIEQALRMHDPNAEALRHLEIRYLSAMKVCIVSN